MLSTFSYIRTILFYLCMISWRRDPCLAPFIPSASSILCIHGAHYRASLSSHHLPPFLLKSSFTSNTTKKQTAEQSGKRRWNKQISLFLPYPPKPSSQTPSPYQTRQHQRSTVLTLVTRYRTHQGLDRLLKSFICHRSPLM